MTRKNNRTEVTIRGIDGSKQLEAKWDTGADRTAIDHKVAAAVSAGPVVRSLKTKQVAGSERRPVVKLWIEVDGHHELIEAGLSDRDGMSTKVLLGNEVLDAVEDMDNDSPPLAP